MPCEIGGCGAKAKTVCPLCIYWIPSQNSKNYTCRRFYETRLLCTCDDITREECAFYEPKILKGRPNLSGIDWTDSKNEDLKKYKRVYMKEYMRNYRKKGTDDKEDRR